MSEMTGPDLRDRITSDVENRCSHPGDGPLTPDGEHCLSCSEIVNDLWVTVSADLARRDAELRQLHVLFDKAQETLPIEQRRLLSISRMVFDRHAEGYTLDRDEAADLAQRIVDEIGHSVTEEPALGPSFRVEIDQLKSTIKQHEDLLASIALYIKWRYVTQQLTTPQKDLFADALERNAFRMHGPDGEEPDPEMAGLPSYAPRWWRDEEQPASP